jgi:multidrug efflux pump subunit AcrB
MIKIVPDTEKLLLYEIDNTELIKTLRVLFQGYEILKINESSGYIPIVLKSSHPGLEAIYDTELVSRNGSHYPMANFLKLNYVNNTTCIRADAKGNYLSVEISDIEKFNEIKDELIATSNKENIQIELSGFFARRKQMAEEFMTIAFVTIVLLFLILAAQFESVLLPAIVLMELVFDIAGSLVFLYVFDSDLNVMSGIGIIIMSGIVINDSIIKISAIENEKRDGKSIIESIKIGGSKRFNPIIMTSLTTILSLIPFFFFTGLGVELQVPLALSIIGGLTTGTIISLYFIPVMYYILRSISKY